jgi:type I restriction enzyme S subunit
MMTDWEEVKLGDICAVKGGKRLPAGHMLVDHRTAHPYIKARDIRYGKVSSAELQFLEPATFEKIKRYTTNQGDVCITIVANIGDVGIVPKELDGASLTENAVKLTNLRKDVDPRFLALQLAHRQFKEFMELLAAGAAQSKLGIYKIKIIKVRLPSITIQAKIAASISAYDELIENNQQRIVLLEKMAEEIYREWFVRLRFPGHEQVKFVKGVPEGWEVRTLSSFASEIRKSVKKKNLSDVEKYIGLEHIPRRSIAIKEWATADTVDSDKLLFQEGDILFCKIRPYLHKVALSHVSGACSSDTIVIRPQSKIYEGYLLFTVFSDTFIELATVASKGTKMPRADWGFLKKLELAVPNTQLLEAYQAQFDTLFSQIVNLLRENEALRATRDLLYPRLISGKLSVESLDIQFPPSMAEDAHA